MATAALDRLYVSHVAYRSQINITHPGLIQEPDIGMGSAIFRIPEFVRHQDKRRPPGYTAWDILQADTELRYHWAAPDELKKRYGTDFWGHVKAEGEEVRLEVTCRNIGDEPAPGGVSLFCLQAGPMREFWDYDGINTFVYVKDRFVSFSEMIAGAFPDHRMVGFKRAAGEPGHCQVSSALIAKRSKETGFVLAVAVDPCGSVGANFQIWPSCIHSNPEWGVLQPGEQATVHGKVYFFRGTLEQLLERYLRDLEG